MTLYSKQDLKESQELYHGCEFISKKTRSIYAWRTALWVRFCKEHKIDYAVTEDKLIEYLDWLFEIDMVNNINTKKTYVPDILRDQMGSVICLWRIQTGNDPDLVSPKEGTRYQAKWDEILRSYPRRERFYARPSLPDGQRVNDTMRSLMPESSTHMHSSYNPSYSRDANGHRFMPNHSGHQQSPPPQPQPLSIAPFHHTQHSFQMHGHRPMVQPHNLRTQHQQHQLVGVAESTELCWQLGWTLSESWEPAASRLLFTLAMATWVEATCVVSLRLSDVHFASSTMAPRLPSSVLRISLVVPQTSSARHGPSGPGPASFTARQQFSIMRSRNPLLCSWNALAVALFYRWHIAGVPPPTFANSLWMNALVVSFNQPGSTPPSMALDAGKGMHMAAAIESKLVSATERLSLVRELLPRDRLPMERVVRQHGLQCALSLSPHRAHGAIVQRDLQADIDFAPLADGGCPDRLGQLCAANGGYFAHHHTIQRHKVIPPESLQHTIFPWAAALASTVPASASFGAQRDASRFLDFLFDLRIVLLQDMAMLKCCRAPILCKDEAASAFGSQVFNTPEFTSYCERMQVEAAEEISLLRHDLEVATTNDQRHGEVGRETSATYHATGQPNDALSPGNTLPPMLSQRRVGGFMMPDSPDRESFSPTISPSPPVQVPRTMSRNPAPFAKSPREIDLQRQRTPLLAHQASQSHSLPTRQLDGWADSYFSNAGASGDNTSSNDNGTPGGLGAVGPFSTTDGLAPSPKRRRQEVGSTLFSLSENAMPRSSSPYNRATSPKVDRRPLHSPRLSRSPPGPVHSPVIGSMGCSSYRVGPPSTVAATLLPSISHFVQSASGAQPLPIGGSPGTRQAAAYEQQQRQQQYRSGVPIRRDVVESHLPPSSLRRSSGSFGEESSVGGIGDTTVTGRDELSRSEQSQISILREENAYLRERLHRLEFSVTQRQAEMESWMGRMERHIMRSDERPL